MTAGLPAGGAVQVTRMRPPLLAAFTSEGGAGTAYVAWVASPRGPAAELFETEAPAPAASARAASAAGAIAGTLITGGNVADRGTPVSRYGGQNDSGAALPYPSR